MRSTRLLAATAVVGLAFMPGAGRADEPTPDHVVQVGAVHPTDPEKPFGYTRFYPDHLGVHRGDLVQWRWASASYFAWHTVSFIAEDIDVASYPVGNESAMIPPFRSDETPRSVALDERFVFGRPRGGRSGEAECGRGSWRSEA